MNGNLLDINDEVPFDLPDSWVWARLSTVCNMYTGNSISEKDKSTYYTGVLGMQYIGTKDVRFDNSIDYKNGIAIPDMFLPNFKIAPAGSVLMCIEGGSAGRKFGQTDRDVCFGNKLCCFSSFGCYQRYLYYYIQSPSFFESFQKSKELKLLALQDFVLKSHKSLKNRLKSHALSRLILRAFAICLFDMPAFFS